MKKLFFIIIVILAIILVSGGCTLQPIDNSSENEDSTSENEEESSSEESSDEEIEDVYVAYNVNNIWHEELLTEDWNSDDATYWNYISEGLRYWDRECTDPILGNDRNAVNSHDGRLYWNGTEFVPYNER